MMKLKPTTAQTVAVHTLESAGASVLITVVLGVGQYIATNGLNIQGLTTCAGTLFVGCMAMVYKSLLLNTQVMQGAADTVNEVRMAVQADIQRLIQTLTGGQTIPTPQLLQAPASLDAASVADTILQHLDLGQVASGLATELMKVRMPQSMPAVQPQVVPPRPTAQPSAAFLQQQPQPPYTAG